MSQSRNIFEALQKYGSHASENYLTEAFVYLLDLLLDREPVAGLEMINRLCGLNTSEQLIESDVIKIETQEILKDGGIVDIVIRSGKAALFYVEVELDAPLDGDQLRMYREDLLRHHAGQQTGMVFLARSRQAAISTRLLVHEYHHVCWYEVYEWIQRLNVRDEVAVFFATNFEHFLETKSMNYSRVSGEYTDGIASMNNLIQMLRAAISEASPKARVTVTGGFGWRGYKVAPGYFSGIRYDASHLLAFERNNFKRDLNLRDADFFALSRDEQFERIVRFLSECQAEIQQPIH